MMAETYETEDQKLERVQQRRVQMALKHLPDAIAYVRSIATNGQSERGEVVPKMDTPMRVTAAQDSDEVYAILINWVVYLAEDLNLATPSTSAVAWSNKVDVQGFRAGTSPEGAHMLTRLQTMWLSIHFEQILTHPAAGEFRKNVLEMESGLRARYPRSAPRQRPTHSRPCPACGVPAVGAEWFSADPLDVRIACSSCGYDIPGAELEDWMVPELLDDDEEAEGEPLPPVVERCNGSITCTALEHIRGCYATRKRVN